MHSFNLIGPGRLGQTLGHLWVRAGLVNLQALAGRDVARLHAASTFIAPGLPVQTCLALAELPPAAITLIATPDDVLPLLADELMAAPALRAGDIVFHCSGATPSSALAPLRQRGVWVASVHPLKSFADPCSAAASFSGTWCGAEGDAAALMLLQPLFEAVGGHWFALQTEHKLLYHAGAVLACNHLVALLDAALRCMAAAGLPHAAALTALQPLIAGTLNNVMQHGTVAALTGPAARGDMRVLTAQSAATHQLDAAVGAVYDALTVVALELAASKSSA